MHETPTVSPPREWIGSRYSQGWKGVRLLVLGESSHGGGAPPAPRDLVNIHIRGKGRWRATYTRFLKMLAGRKTNLTSEERLACWESLAFTNYISDSTAGAAGDRPSAESWGRSLPVFLEYLNRLQPSPDGVIIWGHPLWNSLQRNLDCRWGEPTHQCLQWDTEKLGGFIHWPGGTPIPAIMIAHPCSPSTKHEKWAPRIETFLFLLRQELSAKSI